jgi:glycosyltransferase involved in cell wall biosynthesis
MAAATVVVVPSTYEGFGLPAVEGMACGVPVLASRAGATVEVCGDAALLVEGDRDGLAAGLRELIERPELRRDLGARGRRRAAEFTWTRTAGEHLRAYEAAWLAAGLRRRE